MAKDEVKSVIRPLGDKVLIRPLSGDALGTTSPSGIIIPDTAQKDRVDRGEVVAVGPGRFDEKAGKRIPVEVKAGDWVIFQWGDKIEYEREDYYLVGESNISAVIEK